MARSVRSDELRTRSARLRLPVARKPVYIKLGAGISLGYRRNETAGAWVLRVADGQGGNWTKSIGHADDYTDADGAAILDYYQAQRRAQDLARGDRAENVSGKLLTVAAAIEQYAIELKLNGKDGRNERRAVQHLPPALANRPVAMLTQGELRDWRNSLPIKPSSINRICNALRAALNHAAAHDDRIANGSAWKIGLRRIDEGGSVRNVILSDDEVRRLIAAAREMDADWGLLVDVAAITGARPSEIKRLRVEDLLSDPPRLLMPTSLKGKGTKATKHRPLAIPETLAARLASNRPAAEMLLRNPCSGKEWAIRDHTRRFTRTVERAGLDPKVVTIYALRHSAVVRMIGANVPLRVIAASLDTSALMLERNYSRHIADHTDALTRGALLAV